MRPVVGLGKLGLLLLEMVPGFLVPLERMVELGFLLPLGLLGLLSVLEPLGLLSVLESLGLLRLLLPEAGLGLLEPLLPVMSARRGRLFGPAPKAPAVFRLRGPAAGLALPREPRVPRTQRETPHRKRREAPAGWPAVRAGQPGESS